MCRVTDPDKHDNLMVYTNAKFRETTGYDDESITDGIEREQRLQQAEIVFQNTQAAIFVIDVIED